MALSSLHKLVIKACVWYIRTSISACLSASLRNLLYKQNFKSDRASSIESYLNVHVWLSYSCVSVALHLTGTKVNLPTELLGI